MNYRDLERANKIRTLWSGGEDAKALAKQFSLSLSTVHKIIRNEHYRDDFYSYETAKVRRDNAKAIADTLNNVTHQRDNIKAKASECEQQAEFLDSVIANLEGFQPNRKRK